MHYIARALWGKTFFAFVLSLWKFSVVLTTWSGEQATMVLGNLSTVFALVYWRFLFFGLFTLSSVLEVKLKESNRLFVCQFQVGIDVVSSKRSITTEATSNSTIPKQDQRPWPTQTECEFRFLHPPLTMPKIYLCRLAIRVFVVFVLCICAFLFAFCFCFFAFFVVTINLTKS